MPKTGAGKGRGIGLLLATGGIWLALGVTLAAGASYRDSAHGNPGYGVNRAAIDARLAGYATGNCGHCHEMHASVGGGEPEPRGGASAHVLFASAFNAARVRNLYVESDNFCFHCHGDTGPQVINQDYSAAFGGAPTGSGPQSILAAFNQPSYHNLYDIWTALQSAPSGAATGNPCVACHNPHLARRNWDSGQPGFPLLSAISRPGSRSLWGETERMASYLAYEAPYAFGTTREPAGVGQADGEKTPDYVGFCTSCHTPATSLWSTPLSRELRKIDWSATGERRDKHGAHARDGGHHLREPYAGAAALKSNFVLSCLDCHEPHGSFNILLLRRRINGEDLEGMVDTTDALGLVCGRCHTDDLAAGAGTGQANRWEHVHHGTADAPYAKGDCGACHPGGDGSVPVSCGNCHGHGMDDGWAGPRKTGRGTF